MSKEDVIDMIGEVVDVLPGSKFKVLLDGSNTECTCVLAGKLKMNHIRIIKGDNVDVELSAYDLTNGRIVWRNNK